MTASVHLLRLDRTPREGRVPSLSVRPASPSFTLKQIARENPLWELERLTPELKDVAWTLWCSGLVDTADIAGCLGVPEAAVFNFIREKRDAIWRATH